MQEDFRKTISFYDDLCKSWVIKAVRPTLLSIFNDKKLQMNIIRVSISKKELNSRIIRNQIRVKGIINALIENTELSIIPEPLVLFLHNLSKSNSYLPDNFLPPFHLSRLKLNGEGQLLDMGVEQKALIISYYVISRILIKQMFLNPTDLLNKQATEINKK